MKSEKIISNYRLLRSSKKRQRCCDKDVFLTDSLERRKKIKVLEILLIHGIKKGERSGGRKKERKKQINLSPSEISYKKIANDIKKKKN